MKKIIYLALFTATLISCQQTKSSQVKDSETTSFRVQNSNYDFGEITDQDSVMHDFYLYNKGGKSLIIKDVKASCGCTVPKWSSVPTNPGDSAKISVVFKPNKSNIGVIKKSIIIQANTDSIFHVLYISGNVLRK